VAAVTGQLAYELVNPVSIIHRELIYGMGAAGGLVAAGIFLFDLLIAKHGWCSHVCPMGALYSIIGSVATVRVATPNRSQCDDCMECFEVCPEPKILPPALKQGMRQGLPARVTSSLCTRCGRCIDICSKDVFAFDLLTLGKASSAKPEDSAGKEEKRELKKAS